MILAALLFYSCLVLFAFCAFAMTTPPRRQNHIGNNHPHCITKGSGGVSFHASTNSSERKRNNG